MHGGRRGKRCRKNQSTLKPKKNEMSNESFTRFMIFADDAKLSGGEANSSAIIKLHTHNQYITHTQHAPIIAVLALL